MSKSKLVTIHEAAQTGILPENTLRKLCRKNEVPCLHVGTRTYINLEVLMDYLSDPKTFLQKDGEKNE